jgi:MFS family permease
MQGTAQQATATHLPRQVTLLGWVSFFQDVSGEMVSPVVPLFVVGVLGASATSLGWIDGVATAAIAMMTAWAGWRSDRVVDGTRRRVPWIRWGYGLPMVGKGLLASAFAWPMVMAGRTVDRVGKGLRSSTRDALIADAVPKEQRGRAFGFHRAMDAAGSVVGVVISATLLWWLVGSAAPHEAGAAEAAVSATSADLARHAPAFRTIFGVAAGLGLVAWWLTFLVRESGRAESTPGLSAGVDARAKGAGAAAEDVPRSGPLGLSPAYWRTLAIVLVFALANSSDTFLMLRARDVGLAPWAVALAYALFMLTQAALSHPAGVISDTMGRWRVIGLGWAIYAVVYAGFAFTGAAGVWPLLALYGVYMALTDGVTKALITDHAPVERRGAALGIFYMASGLVTLIASVAAGVLWDRLGPEVAFGFGAVVATGAVMFIPVLRPRSPSPTMMGEGKPS